MMTVEQILSAADDSRKALTYRQLLLWLERDSETREDGFLDMLVVVRVETEDGCVVCGNLYDIDVDGGCSDEDALILDAAQDAAP